MNIKLSAKIIFAFALVLLLIGIILLRDSCVDEYVEGHSFPDYDEIYQVLKPETNEPIIRVYSKYWLDGHWSGPTVLFRDNDDVIWILYALDGDPSTWAIQRRQTIHATDDGKFLPLSSGKKINVGTELSPGGLSWAEMDSIFEMDD